ncbi:MAG: TPM domain-containing protein [Flavobacteriaceae bacterium]|nr:TPM domain-containing protein [Flavobacteriaceae bacterium]
MNAQTEAFLTAAEEAQIVQAIQEAEKNTSGEIRVHLEQHWEGEHLQHAVQLFHQMEMDKTKERNGVLFYIAVADHKFVIYGDEGIHQKVADNFWDSTKDIVIGYFKKQAFAKGLIAGIQEAGLQLKKHFPWEANDSNELQDEISKS